jgi:hypothetical protein
MMVDEKHTAHVAHRCTVRVGEGISRFRESTLELIISGATLDARSLSTSTTPLSS